MGIWPTHVDENLVTTLHPMLPEGAVENSPGQTLTLSEANGDGAALGKDVDWSNRPRRGHRSPAVDFRRSERTSRKPALSLSKGTCVFGLSVASSQSSQPVSDPLCGIGMSLGPR